MLGRPKFARAIPSERRGFTMAILRDAALWYEPTVPVTDCRDPKDDKYWS